MSEYLATGRYAAERLAADLNGLGPLQQLLSDPAVTDVLVNGAGPVLVDRGRGPVRSEVLIDSEAAARRLAVRAVASAGRRLDDAAPYADARLPDGTRVHAVIPPVSPEGTHLSLRVPPRRAFSLDDLVDLGSLPVAGVDLLRRLIAARAAFILTGGTGSGKTTVLSSLLSLADPAERLVLVEDAAELRPAHPHVVRLEARPPNTEGQGAVSLEVLVRQALRMRPSRLVVGEARGPEVLDLLAALNTGHEGGCSTIHANRAQQLPARVEALCGQAGVPRPTAHSLLLAAIDAVIHLSRGVDGRRRVSGIAMLAALPDGTARVEPAYLFDAGAVRRGAAADAFEDRLDRR